MTEPHNARWASNRQPASPTRRTPRYKKREKPLDREKEWRTGEFIAALLKKDRGISLSVKLCQFAGGREPAFDLVLTPSTGAAVSSTDSGAGPITVEVKSRDTYDSSFFEREGVYFCRFKIPDLLRLLDADAEVLFVVRARDAILVAELHDHGVKTKLHMTPEKVGRTDRGRDERRHEFIVPSECFTVYRYEDLREGWRDYLLVGATELPEDAKVLSTLD